jgi:hypothetical protein
LILSACVIVIFLQAYAMLDSIFQERAMTKVYNG